MNTPSPPGFLMLSLPASPVGAADPVSDWARVVEAEGGAIVAVGAASDNAYLEIGTPPKSIIVATWPSTAAVRAAWSAIARTIIRGDGADLVALACPGLTEEGAADLPNPANAAPVDLPGPPAFMVIEGVVTDAEPMGRYRDIIFPMISERGGYYLVYLPRDRVTVLHGDWPQHALIVSRWPNAAAANDFWYSDRYQTLAIPTRTGAGAFSVVLLPSA